MDPKFQKILMAEDTRRDQLVLEVPQFKSHIADTHQYRYWPIDKEDPECDTLYAHSYEDRKDIVKHMLNQFMIDPELINYIQPLPDVHIGYGGDFHYHTYPLNGLYPTRILGIKETKVAFPDNYFISLYSKQAYQLAPKYHALLLNKLAHGELEMVESVGG